MQAYDIFMVVVLAAATIWGLWKGLAWQIASLGSIFLSYFVASQFCHQVAAYINTEPPWNVFLAMLILYVVTSALVWMAFRAVRAFIDQVKLKEFDHQVGAILGAAKGVILCVIITLFAVTLASEGQRQAIIESRSGYYIAQLLDNSDVIIPAEIHEILEPYLHHLDESLDPRSDNYGPEFGDRGYDDRGWGPSPREWGLTEGVKQAVFDSLSLPAPELRDVQADYHEDHGNRYGELPEESRDPRYADRRLGASR